MTTTDRSIDSLGMLDAAASLPEQVAAAVEAAGRVEDLPSREEIEHVVVLGMGGSGIAGDVIAAAAGPFMPVPVVTVKSYVLPAFVSDSSLVFAISVSGNTEEVVETATEAALQGAKVVVVTQGGQLGRLAEGWHAPYVNVPDDVPMPRSAIGSIAVPPLAILEDIGLFPGARQWIADAIDQLRVRRDQLVKPGSAAEELARRIGRTIPLVYGGGGSGSVAALRWKAEFNENAKIPAFWNTVPEATHNEICGWGQHGDLTRQAVTLVALRTDEEHPQVQRRFELLYEQMDEVVASIEEVRAEGDGALAQLFDLFLFGSFCSIHRALQEGVDPGPIPAIDQIRQGITER